MRKKLLVVFFMAFFFSLLIYKFCYKKQNEVLLLGEYNGFNYEVLNIINKEYNFNTFLYDKINYKELINSIKNNDYYISKSKKIYLNQLMSKANIIIISAENSEYNTKCNKGEYIFNNYKDRLQTTKNNLLKIISKISNAKVIFINNKC